MLIPEEPNLDQVKRPSILVVDDSELVRGQVRALLEQEPLNAVVTEAVDGSDALREALANPYDCVICDLLMPVMDGFRFVTALRQRHPRLALPVLMLTVRDNLETKVRGFEAGASDFIVKPFLDEEFRARVQTHVILAQLYRRTAEQNLRLQVMAKTDGLTEIPNRRAFMERLEEEFSRTRRKDTRVSLCILDLDHFKQINDTHGHQVGDRALVATAKVLTAAGRRYDFVGRVGGEEFGVLLPDCGLEEAVGVAARIRGQLAAVEVEPLKAGDITTSVGVTVTTGHEADSVERLYARADRALYQAKNAGRNQVQASPFDPNAGHTE
jgi:diguanylate cyclase (GGDEF)-like protein